MLQLENDLSPVTNQTPGGQELATIVLSCFSCEAEPFFGRIHSNEIDVLFVRKFDLNPFSFIVQFTERILVVHGRQIGKPLRQA